MNTVGVLAVRPDSSALLVSKLETPLGTLPAAVLRADDVVVVTASFEKSGGGSNSEGMKKQEGLASGSRLDGSAVTDNVP